MSPKPQTVPFIAGNEHYQGLIADSAEEPEASEVGMWRATHVAREVILLAPEGMTKTETEEYFDSLVDYLVLLSKIGYELTDLSRFRKRFISRQRRSLQI